MKTLRTLIVLFMAFALVYSCKSNNGNEQQKSDKSAKTDSARLVSKWSTDSVLMIPESVCYDASNDVLYVSNIQGNSNEKDGKGFISKLSPKGEMLELKWVTGLDAPKGMGVYKGKLYVTNIDELVEIDIEQGKINKRYPLEGAQFANDIAINKKGMVFISGMSTGRVYRFQGESAEIWIESEKLNRPNGLYTTKKNLMIGTNGFVYKVDYESGELQEYITNTGGIDGLEEVGDGYFIKSDWAGHIHLIHPEKEKQLLLNTADDNINAADIDFVQQTNMLYVPTFMDNRVMAYKLEK